MALLPEITYEGQDRVTRSHSWRIHGIKIVGPTRGHVEDRQDYWVHFIRANCSGALNYQGPR